MSRDQERELTRRALIQWSLAAGAALGVSQSRVLDILERTAGHAHRRSRDRDARRSARSTFAPVDGGLAWFTLLWPHNDIAARRADQSDNDLAARRRRRHR